MKETPSNNKNTAKISQRNPDLEQLYIYIYINKNCFPHRIRRRRTLKCLDQPHLAANLKGVGYRNTQISGMFCRSEPILVDSFVKFNSFASHSLSVNISAHAFGVEKIKLQVLWTFANGFWFECAEIVCTD